MIGSAETRIFRATAEAWLGQLLLPLVFFCLLTLTAVNAAALDPRAAGAGLSLVLAVAALQYLLPMLRNYLLVDERSIRGFVNGRAFQVYKTEIVAAWMSENRGRRYLCLGTRAGTLVLPLRFFNVAAVWACVRACLPAAALEENAVSRLPDYQTWEAARAQILEKAQPGAAIDHWGILVAAWAGMAFFTAWAADLLAGGRYLGAALCALPLAACVVTLARWGITRVSENDVERATLFGAARMGWDEVTGIEVGPLSLTMVFHGANCRLVIPGPGLWFSRGGKNALLMILLQAQRRKIPMHRTWLAPLRLSRTVQRDRRSAQRKKGSQ